MTPNPTPAVELFAAVLALRWKGETRTVGELFAPGGPLADRSPEAATLDDVLKLAACYHDLYAPPPLPPHSRYDEAAWVAGGGMGQVYRVRDLKLKRHVVLKLMRRGSPDAFRREVEVTARLNHPNVVRLYDAGELGGTPFYTMPEIRGQSLAVLIPIGAGRPRPESLQRLLGHFEAVCGAIGHAHEQGFVHCDLKPDNIKVEETGVVVIDWGLARRCGDRLPTIPDPTDARPDDPSDRTRPFGTWPYMAPELFDKTPLAAGPAIDVFALGAVLCEILTGEGPYAATGPVPPGRDELSARLDRTSERLDRCGAHADLIALAMRCLARAPGDRPPDGRAVAAAVADYRGRAEAERLKALQDAARANAAAAGQHRLRRVQVRLAAAVAFLLIGAGVVAWWADRRATRNGYAVAVLLDQCEDALRADDADRAAQTLEQAETRRPEGGVGRLRERFARCRADLEMLRELDRISDLRWGVARGRHRHLDEVVRRLTGAFTSYGVEPSQTLPEMTQRVSRSLIRDQLLRHLDWLLIWTRRPDLPPLLQAVDPDPYRDKIRAAIAADDWGTVGDLIAQPAILNQPARFAVVVGELEGAAPGIRAEVLRKMILRQPSKYYLLMALGSLHTRETYWPPDRSAGGIDRIGCYRAAVALRPSNAAAWNELGDALVGEQHFDEAIRCFEEATRLDPQYALPHYNLGVVWYARGETDKAIASYRVALQLEPTDAATLNNLGLVLKAVGRWDDAVASFREAIRVDPGLAAAHNSLGVALLEKNPGREAVGHLREAVRLAPGNAVFHYNLGTALASGDDPGGAIPEYRESIRLDRSRPGTHLNLGIALLNTKNPKEAAAAFREVIRLDPTSAPAHDHLGVALRDLGDLDGAVACHQTAILHDPKSVTAYYHLGKALSAKKDLGGAIGAYRYSLQVHPEDADVHEALGIAYGDQREWKKAGEAFAMAVRLNPKKAGAHFGLGVARGTQGDLDGAIRAFEEACRLDPQDPSHRQALELARRYKAERDASIAPRPRPVDR